MKQASRQWFTKLMDALINLRFIQSRNDYSMFTRRQHENITILTVYVDNILIIENCPTNIQGTKSFLTNTFSIKNMGISRYFLGFELAYLKGSPSYNESSPKILSMIVG